MFQIQTIILSSKLIGLWQLNKDRSKSDSDSGCDFVSANREWVHDLFQPRIGHTSPTHSFLMNHGDPLVCAVCCEALTVEHNLYLFASTAPLEALSPFCKPQQGAGRWELALNDYSNSLKDAIWSRLCKCQVIYQLFKLLLLGGPLYSSLSSLLLLLCYCHCYSSLFC